MSKTILTLASLLTQADATKAIVTLRTDAKSVQDRIHLIACSTLDHIRAHGDTRGACELLNALPKGQRVKALAHWYKHFSSDKAVFQIEKSSGTWNCKLSKDRKDSDFKVSDSLDKDFADLTEEKDPKPITVETMLRNLERNAKNDEKFDGTDIAKVEPAARALAAKILAFVKNSPSTDIATVSAAA